MDPNKFRVILIFLITPTTTWQFAGFPYTTETQKAAKISNKSAYFNWVHYILTKSMNATHLFKNSCHYVSTNGYAPPHCQITYNTPQFRRANAPNISFLNLWRW